MAYELFPDDLDAPKELIDTFENDLGLIRETLRETPGEWIAVAVSPFYDSIAGLRDAFWINRPDLGLTTYRRQAVFDETTERWVLFAKLAKDGDDITAKGEASENEILLCKTIAEMAETNGYKVANAVTKTNIHWARLCFKRAADLGKSEESVIKLAKWALTHDFWMQNIRSVNKFYKQYDRLREQANREFNSPSSKVWNNDGKVKQKTASVWDVVSDGS